MLLLRKYQWAGRFRNGEEATVGDGSIVGFFVIAILCEGVRDACEFRLGDTVFNGIVKALGRVVRNLTDQECGAQVVLAR